MSSSKVIQSDDADDLPELDDFSEVLSKMKTTNLEQKEGIEKPYVGDYTEVKKEYSEPNIPTSNDNVSSSDLNTKTSTGKTDNNNADSGSFGGLKKGFFSKPSEPKKALKPEGKRPEEKKPEKKEEIVTLKANKEEAKKNRLEIPEVQSAMKTNNALLENKNQWLTPDLLEKVSQNPLLLKMFTNPEYMKAISMMQTNPKQAMEVYGTNPEFMQIFQEFCKLMGTHFTEISEKEKAPPTEPAVEQIQDQEVNEILKDPKIKSILEFLQKNQKADFHKIMGSDPSVAEKMNILIKKGFIKLQSY